VAKLHQESIPQNLGEVLTGVSGEDIDKLAERLFNMIKDQQIASEDLADVVFGSSVDAGELGLDVEVE
jgi:hypothetical protein